MKKLLAATLVLGILLGGCGGPTPKEEAKMINDKYASQESTAGKLTYEQLTILSDEKTAMAKLDVLEKNNALLRQEIEKIKAEKISDNVKPYKDAIIKRNQILAELVDVVMDGRKAEINNDQQGVDKALEKMERLFKELDVVAFDAKNEKHKIDTGKPLSTLKAGDKEYVCSTASNVSMCVTNYKISTKPISDGFSTPIAPIGKFVYVTVAVYNDQKDAISVDANNFKIIYKDREYSHHPTAQFTYDVTKKASMSARLNPGMMMTHTYIFDVPKDFDKSDAKVQARGGFTGEKVLLDIPAIKKPVM